MERIINKEITNIDDFIQANNITTIFLDVDGVIFSSCQAMVDILNEKNDTNFNGANVFSWDFKEIDPTISGQGVEELFSDKKFFKVVKPIKGALDFLEKYRDRIIIVTKSQPNNFILKRKWFDKKGFSDIPIIAIPLEISKSIIDMFGYDGTTLFIDDSTKNLEECSSADFSIQFREYNDDQNDKREWIKDWDGFVMYHF